MSNPPVCECGERAIARFVDPTKANVLFTCEECTIRNVRVTRAMGLLLDIDVRVPGEHAHKVELPKSKGKGSPSPDTGSHMP